MHSRRVLQRCLCVGVPTSVNAGVGGACRLLMAETKRDEKSTEFLCCEGSIKAIKAPMQRISRRDLKSCRRFG